MVSKFYFKNNFKNIFKNLKYVISLGLTISNATTRITTHSCHRKCVLGQSMTCAYTLMVQNYVTLSTECLSCPHNKGHCKLYGCIPVNGVQRCITIINMQNPGPIVDVRYYL